jgi:hypothetical protein
MVDFGKLLHDGAWRRISKVAGMLGSPHDGERLNAARLLERELAKAEMSFADLAERLERGGSSAPVERVVYRRATANPAADIATKILAKYEDRVTGIERRFLRSILTQSAMTNGDFDLTASQARWLTMIEQSYCSGRPPDRRKPRTPPKPIPDDMLDDLGLGEPPKPEARQWKGWKPMPDAREDKEAFTTTERAAGPVDADTLDDLGLGDTQGTFKGEPVDRHADVKQRFEGLDLDDEIPF